MNAQTEAAAREPQLIAQFRGKNRDLQQILRAAHNCQFCTAIETFRNSVDTLDQFLRIVCIERTPMDGDQLMIQVHDLAELGMIPGTATVAELSHPNPPWKYRASKEFNGVLFHCVATVADVRRVSCTASVEGRGQAK